MKETEETQVQSLDWEDALEKGMATRSSILAWRIPWTDEPGRLQSRGSRTVGLNWSDLAHAHGGLKTTVYLCGVIFRSYEGTTVMFSYSVSTLCNEIFPFILKDTLKILLMFLGLHSPYPSLLFCALGSPLQLHQWLIWPLLGVGSSLWGALAGDLRVGGECGWVCFPDSFPARSSLAVCPSVNGQSSCQVALPTQPTTSGSSIFSTPCLCWPRIDK